MRRGTHTRRYSHARAEILCRNAIPCPTPPPPARAPGMFTSGARASRPTFDLRHRQRRCRQVDRRDSARRAGGSQREAHGRGRAGQPGTGPGRVRPAGRAVRGGAAVTAALHHLDRPGGRYGGVPAGQDRSAGSGAWLEQALPGPGDGYAGDARAAERGQGLGARSASAPHERRRALRPRGRRLRADGRDDPAALAARRARLVHGSRVRRAAPAHAPRASGAQPGLGHPDCRRPGVRSHSPFL